MKHIESTKEYSGSFAKAYGALRAFRRRYCDEPSAEWDQCPATIDTTIRRLQLLEAHQQLAGRRVLLLGDDDLLSLAIASEYSTSCVTVLDCDTSLLKRIQSAVPGESIQIVRHDIRDPLPHSLSHRFDCVFTDPPYTVAGQTLFLHRAVGALLPVSASAVYVCASRLYLSDVQLASVRRFAVGIGLNLKNKQENFNEYRAPADVLNDMKRRRCPINKYFRSTLFHFNLQNPGRLSSIRQPSVTNIYNYEEENGTT